MQSFIFGKGSGVSTPQELARRREIARALMERSAGQVPKTAWEGLNAIAEAIGSRIENNRLDAAEAEGRERATAKFRALFNGQFDSTPFDPYRAKVTEQTGRSASDGISSPVLADVLSDPWLSEEQRSFANSMFGPSERVSRNVDEVASPPLPERKPVVRPRRPGAHQNIGGMGMNPAGGGMTVDSNGNVVGWP